MQYLIAALLLTSTSVQAQSAMPTSFPEGLTVPTAQDVKARLSGNVFAVKTFAGAQWRLQYRDNGFFFINVGGFSDSGEWKAEDGKVCSKPQKSPASCNELRMAADAIYLKRDSGEVILLLKQ